jgi:hypothetical protein
MERKSRSRQAKITIGLDLGEKQRHQFRGCGSEGRHSGGFLDHESLFLGHDALVFRFGVEFCKCERRRALREFA